MSITSFYFPVFLVLLLCAYYLMPRKFQWICLLCGSCFFYLWAGIEFLGFILITAVTVFLTAALIGKRLDAQKEYLQLNKASLSSQEKKNYKAGVKKINRILLLGCLILNFGILAFCKFAIANPLKSVLEQGSMSFLTIGLPLGISFYMFQASGYLIDVYKGKAVYEKNFFHFALFISFFPQLIQGPISKFSQLSPQLLSGHEYDGKQISFGFQRILWGYFKKLVIADRISAAVVALKNPEFGGMGFFLLSVFYAVQIYCDFTGGIDVAIGVGEAFGIRLIENFIRPYFSKNIAEYWRRWHISLGEWMKNYIFYPISMSQPMLKLSRFSRKKLGDLGKRVPVYVASIATWLVTGIWHGITPNFVLWGLMNCFVIVVSEELSPVYTKFHNRFHLNEKKWYDGFQIIRMFLLMNLIRVCDLFPHVTDYWHGYASVFTNPHFSALWDGTLMKLGLSALDYGIIAAGIILVFCISVLQEKRGSVRELLWSHTALRYLCVCALLLIVLLMGSYGIGYQAGNFIYNQF